MPSVTDRSIALIRTPDAISATWLQGVLQAHGSLPAATSIASITSSRIGEGIGVLSRIFRVTPTYVGPHESAPTSVIVKLATDDDIIRLTADLLGAFAREVRFYCELAETTSLRTAHCFAAVQATDNTDFTLVLEDLHYARFQDQLEGCTWEDSLASIGALAAFHAECADPSKHQPFANTFTPLLNDGFLAFLPMLFQSNWERATEIFAELLDPRIIEFGNNWGSHLEFMLTKLSSPYTTLCHGDWRADNVMFADDQVLGIDFQLVGIGSGTFDVAYFVSQSIDASVRAGRDRELLDHYVHCLSIHGIEVDREIVWNQYKVGLLFDLSYPINAALAWDSMNERAHALVHSMLTRASQAIIDTNAFDVLPT